MHPFLQSKSFWRNQQERTEFTLKILDKDTGSYLFSFGRNPNLQGKGIFY